MGNVHCKGSNSDNEPCLSYRRKGGDPHFDAAQGTAGLKGYTGDVYAHTGVITDQSEKESDWRYASDWNVNVAKYKMTSLGNNKWELNITPDVRSYYGVPAGEKILKMAFVFRSSDGKRREKIPVARIFLWIYMKQD